MEKKVYEVFKTKGFTAVVVPGSKASRELFKQGYYKGDVRLEEPKQWYFMENVGLVKQVKEKENA